VAATRVPDAAEASGAYSVIAIALPLMTSAVAVAHDTIRRDIRGKAIPHLIAQVGLLQRSGRSAGRLQRSGRSGWPAMAIWLFSRPSTAIRLFWLACYGDQVVQQAVYGDLVVQVGRLWRSGCSGRQAGRKVG
jgi:hypothetical protein